MSPTPSSPVRGGINSTTAPCPTLAAERATYAYVGNGRFMPANAAAWREVDAWNEYATMMTDRSAAARSLRQ